MNNYFDTLKALTIQNREDIDEHLLTLFSLTLSMKPNHVIELGVRTARSSYAFLAACQEINCPLTSVDISPMFPSLPIPEEWKKHWTFKQKDAVSFLKDDAPSLCGSPGNLIYIDDWHSGDHVDKEISLVSEFCGPEDLIILHDLMYGNAQPHYRSVETPADPQWANGGPYRAISNLDLDLWEYSTIPRCHGLTILRKKSSKVLDV